jgi:hypothetical protein
MLSGWFRAGTDKPNTKQGMYEAIPEPIPANPPSPYHVFFLVLDFSVVKYSLSASVSASDLKHLPKKIW